MSKSFLSLFTALFSLGLSAAVTNVVDIAALAACGTGTTNGWTVSGLDSYSDNSSNIRFSEKGDYAESPEFQSSIRTIALKIKSSSQEKRKLAFIPFVNGMYAPSFQATCEYSPNKDTYVDEELVFSSDIEFTSFKIAFDDGGGNTGWGISYMVVITDDPSLATVPSSLDATTKGTTAKLDWSNDVNTSSNRIALSRIIHTDESYSVVEDYDFDECENTGNSETQERSTVFHNSYPKFTASKLYYPTNYPGTFRISNSSTNGCLTYVGFSDCTSVSMEITSMRYAGDTGLKNISAYYIDPQSSTNVIIGSVPATDEFARGIISLSYVPANTAINLGNLDGAKTNRRFLIDRIRFLKDYIPESTTTNFVHNVNVAAVSTGVNSATLNGLEPQSVYLVTISAFDIHGRESAPSEPLVFTTGRKPGTFVKFW